MINSSSTTTFYHTTTNSNSSNTTTTTATTTTTTNKITNYNSFIPLSNINTNNTLLLTPYDRLSSLPLNINKLLLTFCTAQTIHALERTNKFWWNSCIDWIPSNLGNSQQFRLYPHQIKALQRIRARELPHFLHDGNGSILCDEPGLGKTLTTLCVILRTQGMLPNPNNSSAPNPWLNKRPSPSRLTLAAEFDRANHLPLHAGTLLVVPKPLLNHWKTQIQKHCPNLPTLFVSEPPTTTMTNHNHQQETISPLLLPHIALFVVSFTRLSLEMTNLGIQQSPFSSVKWLRLVVDEGHALDSQSRTNYGEFLTHIQSERRLLLTGTPTKKLQLNHSESLHTLFELLTFVRSSSTCHALEQVISQSNKRNNQTIMFSNFEQAITNVISSVMIRHTKADIVESLPTLIRLVERLEFDPLERKVYNTLVSFVRTNIMMTSIGTGGREQSLLHASQRKFALELLRNMRIACCSVTRLILRLSEKNRLETQQLIDEQHNDWTTEQRLHVQEFLERTQRWDDSECDCCHDQFPLMIVLECAHLICVNCFGNQVLNHHEEEEIVEEEEENSLQTHEQQQQQQQEIPLSCPICQIHIEPNSLAAFQPGFELTFFDGGVPNNNNNHDILLQQQQQQLLVAGQIHSAKEKWLISKLENAPPGFKAIVFSQFRSVLNLIGHTIIQRFGSDCVAEFWGHYQQQELEKYMKGVVKEWTCKSCGRICTDVLKASCGGVKWEVVVFDEQQQPVQQPNNQQPANNNNNNPIPHRSIRIDRPDLTIPDYHEGLGVGYQFQHEGKLAQVSKIIKCRGLVRDSQWRERQVDAKILLLGRDGSTGLDLSMTTHVFLMDVLWDAALDQQVISRAWRIGNQSQQVVVEQLVMKNTIEDLMLIEVNHSQNNIHNSQLGVDGETTATTTPSTVTTSSSSNNSINTNKDDTRRVKNLFSMLRCLNKVDGE
jgi:SNF2 family DNA or RNA helicase